jgi:hypothetical protein
MTGTGMPYHFGIIEIEPVEYSFIIFGCIRPGAQVKDDGYFHSMIFQPFSEFHPVDLFQESLAVKILFLILPAEIINQHYFFIPFVIQLSDKATPYKTGRPGYNDLAHPCDFIDINQSYNLSSQSGFSSLIFYTPYADIIYICSPYILFILQ